MLEQYGRRAWRPPRTAEHGDTGAAVHELGAADSSSRASAGCRPRRQQEAITDTGLNGASEGASFGYHVTYHGNTQERDQPYVDVDDASLVPHGGPANQLADRNGGGSRMFASAASYCWGKLRFERWGL